ncbi:hypothetical protein [Flagellimonas lutaonensis]|uniref:Uncharacterized protein n=1 Tax=Flagellimonas lutaonensis TaxID=516051 RepID=A0A0D5YW78_9FLAO|nr:MULTISPECIES: hypothetical protein [Allomuricauda]AKA36144.1 hypothetical protein VC82_2580 [Allomuricauda lutaonensis]|tara:strand:- start:1460 stop:1897 length:438 start_codon:yes stop_codon:yes gene_type:complete
MLDVLRLMFDFAILSVLGLLQVAYYPSLKFFPRKELVTWFRNGAENIVWIIVLLAPGQLVISGLQLLEKISFYTVCSFVSIVLMWAYTLQFTIRFYRKIIAGAENAHEMAVKLLVANRLRIVVYTVLFSWTLSRLWHKYPFQTVP